MVGWSIFTSVLWREKLKIENNNNYFPCAEMHTGISPKSYYILYQGRKPQEIDLISRDLSPVTWEEAYMCLVDQTLPGEIRALFCDLIVGRLTLLWGLYSYVLIGFGIATVVGLQETLKLWWQVLNP